MARKTLNDVQTKAIKSGKLLKTTTVRPGEDANIEVLFANTPENIEKYVKVCQDAGLEGFSLRYMGVRVKLTPEVKAARLIADLAKLGIHVPTPEVK